jgi:hypothetical protein
MKMSEGKVKAGYNIQLASENQIIQDYEIMWISLGKMSFI